MSGSRWPEEMAPRLEATVTWLRSLESWAAPVGGPWRAGWAPARLDVMGGIADYSGALVAQLPMAVGTICALRSIGGPQLRLASQSIVGEERFVEVDAAEVLRADSSNEVRERLESAKAPRWSFYPLGVLYELAAAGRWHSEAPGLEIAFHSDVPLGSGLASSASIEIATARALIPELRAEDAALNVARLCQRAENRVAGAACGIMDQVASLLGRRDHLLRLECRPHRIDGHTQVPKGVRFYAIDTGVKHSVGGSRYTSVRVAAFMGRRILREILPGRAELAHLTEVSAKQWESVRSDVPETMIGSEFLQRYGSTGDPVTTVSPEAVYTVRRATEHAIQEQERVESFLMALNEVGGDSESEGLDRAGARMIESHRSYGVNCQLGSKEADRVVERIEAEGREHGCFGARITGGGCGGSVAVLATPQSRQFLERLVADLQRETGFQASLLEGSGPGAMEVPVVTVDAR
ncbi:MAG: hypothetical protein RL885_20330 [Planctomycetota bacterium]